MDEELESKGAEGMPDNTCTGPVPYEQEQDVDGKPAPQAELKSDAARKAQVIINSALYHCGDGPDVGTAADDIFNSCVKQSDELGLHGQWTVTVVTAGSLCATQRNTTFEGVYQFTPQNKYAVVATFTELPKK